MALAMAMVACSGDSTGPKDEAVTGSYSLQTVNGAGLPAVFYQDASTRMDILSSTMSINADGTFSEVSQLRQTTGGVVTTAPYSVIGVYSRVNNSLQFSDSDGDRYTGAVSGRTLTVRYESGLTNVYQR